MPAIIGTIAQEGQTVTASAPTGVSIADSASGNYDNAMVVLGSSSTGFFDALGGDFSSNGYIDDFQGQQMSSAFSGLTPQEIFTFKGYCRATGATSFLWDITIEPVSNVNNLSLSVIGTASTSQDATGTNGVGEKVNWAFAGGKSGTTYPSGGMVLAMTIKCTATNAHGSTDATPINVIYNFN